MQMLRISSLLTWNTYGLSELLRSDPFAKEL
jgi:hypothetical protein